MVYSTRRRAENGIRRAMKDERIEAASIVERAD